MMRNIFKNIEIPESIGGLVDRPTQLICIWIFICQKTNIKDIAGQSAKLEMVDVCLSNIHSKIVRLLGDTVSTIIRGQNYHLFPKLSLSFVSKTNRLYSQN